MTTFIALLRAINVGGTGKLAMSDLAKLNATRRQLRTADIDAIIYRVGD